MPNISVSTETKSELDFIKVHPRETYDEVVARVVKEFNRQRGGNHADPD